MFRRRNHFVLGFVVSESACESYFIINDQIMENELGAWLFIIFFISLFFYSKQQSYFIPHSRILWFKAGVFANLSDENSAIIFMLLFYCFKETAKVSFQWMVPS